MLSHAFFIDVDNTLLNNDLIKEEIKRSLKTTLGAEEAAHFWEHQEAVRKDRMLVDFPAATRQYCAEENGALCQMNVDGIFSGINFAAALFPEVPRVLAYLKTLGTVCIFSEGDMMYQKMKIEKSGLAAAVNQVYLFEHKIDHLPEILAMHTNQQLIFIDDRDSKLMEIKKMIPMALTIVVCQGHYAGEDCAMAHTADRVAGSVADVLEFTAADFAVRK